MLLYNAFLNVQFGSPNTFRVRVFAVWWGVPDTYSCWSSNSRMPF